MAYIHTHTHTQKKSLYISKWLLYICIYIHKKKGFVLQKVETVIVQ